MIRCVTFSMSTKLRWSKAAVAAVFLFSTSPVLLGQILQTARYETVLNDNDRNYYKTVSTHELGVILFRGLSDAKKDQLEIIRVDTALQEKWRGYLELDRSTNFAFSYVRDNMLYLLFKSRDATKGELQIVAMKIETGSYLLHKVKNAIPFNPTEFVVTKDAALIGGYFNYRPLILHYSFAREQSKILPGFFNEPGELTQMKPNNDGSVDVIVSSKNLEKRKGLWIRNYDAEGSLIKTTILQPDEKKNLIFGRSLRMPNGDQVVSGVYGRYTEYSRGIFVASINAFGEYAIKYYPFTELEHFFNYMRASREKRVKEKIERRKVKGKKVRFNYRMLVQELLPYGDQYILLGEAFYPHYSYLNSYSAPFGGYNTRPTAIPGYRNDLVFDGYQYTHAVVIGFDKNGKLLWDNSFEINDAKAFRLDQFVNIYPQDDRIMLLYLYENKIRSKIISGSNVLEGKSIDPIKMKFESDVTKDKETETSSLDYWYGNNFFASGVQKINNTQETTVTFNRKVFFVNKVTCPKPTR